MRGNFFPLTMPGNFSRSDAMSWRWVCQNDWYFAYGSSGGGSDARSVSISSLDGWRVCFLIEIVLEQFPKRRLILRVFYLGLNGFVLCFLSFWHARGIG